MEDLLYALTIQSANDAAVALAIHIAGSKEGFVALMNKRAGELGMVDTTFSSVHGLPPAEGQKPDITTAKDLLDRWFNAGATARPAAWVGSF